jgi:O-6-methylguanine DNA methyltransferase
VKIRCRRHPPVRVAWHVEKSYAGKLLVGLTEKNEICRVAFLRNNKAAKSIVQWRREWPKTEFYPEQKGITHTEKALLVGTDFQCAVWRALAKIPFGTTKTYGDVAQQIGKANAVRAIGGACGANPVPFFIPCHRVVAKNGLGGFSAGLRIKRALLKKEYASIL